jgi:aconitate decarboxylase
MADAEQGLTRQFADVIAAWKADEPEVLEACRQLVVDGLAVAVAGAGERGPAMAGALARGTPGVATVIGQSFSTAPALAARINGMSMHVLDYEPMWSPANHSLSPILPALLALAQQMEAAGAPPQGAAVLRALAKGVEVQGRLRLASRQLEMRTMTLHPPGLVGPIAAACACATLMGLDTDRMVHAIGIAASRSCGLLANIGTMTKALHCGDAAAHGLEAAQLAQAGFTADPDALGATRGWAATYFGDEFDPEHLTAPVVTPRVISPGPAWKLFPSQYPTHFAITAALELAIRPIAADQIASIRVRTPLLPYTDRPAPRSGLDGKFSFQYCVAATLLDGKVGVSTFTDTRRFAPDIEALLPRIQVLQTADIPGRFDLMRVEIELETRQGEILRASCESPPGSWSNPVAAGRLRDKAADAMRGRLPPAGIAAFWDMVDDARSLAVHPLMNLLQAQA